MVLPLLLVPQALFEVEDTTLGGFILQCCYSAGSEAALLTFLFVFLLFLSPSLLCKLLLLFLLALKLLALALTLLLLYIPVS